MRRKKTSATLSQGFIFTGEQAEEVGDSGEKASRHSGGKRARTQEKEEEVEVEGKKKKMRSEILRALTRGRPWT